jgi:hypothetical protein
MQVIIYQHLDNGQFGVVFPTGDLPIEELVKRVVPTGRPYSIIEDFKVDHEFFEAYDYSELGPVFNVERGKEIQRQKWRELREPILKELDVIYMKALEQGDSATQADVAAKKQALRDITLLELPDDIESIRNTWPEILNTNTQQSLVT